MLLNTTGFVLPVKGLTFQLLPACAGVALLLLTMCCSPPVDVAFPCGPAVPALIFGEGPLVGWVSTTCCSLTDEEVEVLAAFATG